MRKNHSNTPLRVDSAQPGDFSQSDRMQRKVEMVRESKKRKTRKNESLSKLRKHI